MQCKPRGCRSVKRTRKRLGPKLYRNLLGAKTSVSIFIEQLDPALLTGTDGPAKLLAELENGRFQKTGFQEMPRAYETFYEKTVFQRSGLEPMASYLTAIEVAKRDLEAVDTKTKISQNELGYHALKNSGLSREEQRMVLSRAEETYDFARISQTLKNLFPRGHTHWKADGTTSNETSTTQSTTTISSRIALGTPGC